jgi:hypothetical protein
MVESDKTAVVCQQKNERGRFIGPACHKALILPETLLKLEAISKMQITCKDKRHTLINTIRCVIPPTRGRGPIRRRLKSYGGTSKKAESAKALWRMSSTF